MIPLRPAVAVFSAIALAACLAPSPPVSPSGDAVPSTHPAASDGASLPTRPASSPPAGSSTTSTSHVAPLSDMEKQLAKTWSRYHVKNKGYSSEYGYYEYVSFNEDRTACRWKYGQDSSTSLTDDLFDSSDYTSWRITEQLSGGGAYYRVFVQGAGLDYVFDFGHNRVYPDGFETLLFGPTTDGKSCFVRGGASY